METQEVLMQSVQKISDVIVFSGEEISKQNRKSIKAKATLPPAKYGQKLRKCFNKIEEAVFNLARVLTVESAIVKASVIEMADAAAVSIGAGGNNAEGFTPEQIAESCDSLNNNLGLVNRNLGNKIAQIATAIQSMRSANSEPIKAAIESVSAAGVRLIEAANHVDKTIEDIKSLSSDDEDDEDDDEGNESDE